MTHIPRKKQFYKTKMCPWYSSGKCDRGDECHFAHSQEELNPIPDLSFTSLCTFAKKTGVCSNDNCNYAHSVSELRPNGDLYKTAPCTKFLRGKCKAGEHCRHAHFLEELRPLPGNSEPSESAVQLMLSNKMRKSQTKNMESLDQILNGNPGSSSFNTMQSCMNKTLSRGFTGGFKQNVTFFKPSRTNLASYHSGIMCNGSNVRNRNNGYVNGKRLNTMMNMMDVSSMDKVHSLPNLGLPFLQNSIHDGYMNYDSSKNLGMATNAPIRSSLDHESLLNSLSGVQDFYSYGSMNPQDTIGNYKNFQRMGTSPLITDESNELLERMKNNRTVGGRNVANNHSRNVTYATEMLDGTGVVDPSAFHMNSLQTLKSAVLQNSGGNNNTRTKNNKNRNKNKNKKNELSTMSNPNPNQNMKDDKSLLNKLNNGTTDSNRNKNKNKNKNNSNSSINNTKRSISNEMSRSLTSVHELFMNSHKNAMNSFSNMNSNHIQFSFPSKENCPDFSFTRMSSRGIPMMNLSCDDGRDATVNAEDPNTIDHMERTVQGSVLKIIDDESDQMDSSDINTFLNLIKENNHCSLENKSFFMSPNESSTMDKNMNLFMQETKDDPNTIFRKRFSIKERNRRR